jgi:hypothetical protein
MLTRAPQRGSARFYQNSSSLTLCDLAVCCCGKVCRVCNRRYRSIFQARREYAGTQQKSAGVAGRFCHYYLWGNMEQHRKQKRSRYCVETLPYSQGIFGRYSDLSISYKSTFACPPESLNQPQWSCKSLWARFHS